MYPSIFFCISDLIALSYNDALPIYHLSITIDANFFRVFKESLHMIDIITKIMLGQILWVALLINLLLCNIVYNK